MTHSSRLTVTAACPMSLWMFPFDRQACSLQLQSYSYNIDQVSYSYSMDQVSYIYNMDQVSYS